MYKLYTSKLNPEVQFLWQCPKKGKLHYIDDRWYNKVRVGHDPIDGLMANLSAECNLSKRYTNHSIHSTVMGMLGEKYEGRIVIGWSGHKSEHTVKQYIRKLPTKQKREMSEYLADNMLPKKAKADPTQKFTFKSKAAETISKPPEQNPEPKPEPPEAVAVQDQQQPAVEFAIEPLDDAPPDDILINFLNAFEQPANNEVALPQAPQNVLQPVGNNNSNNKTMNIQSVQQVTPNKIVPAMYFPNSNVTINYHFSNN